MDLTKKVLEVLGLFVLFFTFSVQQASAQTWSSPFNISNSSEDSIIPKIIEDNSGTLHTVWCENVSNNLEMFYSSKPTNGNWSLPVNISQSPGHCQTSTLAISPDNTVNVAWEESQPSFSNPSPIRIFFVSKSNGGSWDTPVDISPNAGDAYDPSMVVSSNGDLHLAWWDAGNQYVYYAIRPFGGFWSIPSQITSVRGGVTSLAIDSLDSLHLVFHASHFIEETTNIYYLTKPAGGFWSNPALISDCTGIASCNTGRLTARGNNLYLVWHKTTNFPGERDLYYTTKLGGGSWSTPINLTGANGDDSYLYSGGLGVDGAGNVHIVWWSNTSGVRDIFYSVGSGGIWSTPLNLSDSAVFSSYPSLVVGSDNFVHVVWDESVSVETFVPGEIYYRTTAPQNISPTADANGPYSVAEGGIVTLSAVGFDPEGGTLNYAWDLDNNGSFETLGQNVIFSAVGSDGPISQIVSVKVCDPLGACAMASTTVEIVNVAPSIASISVPIDPQQVNTNVSISAVFDDPGVLDTHSAVWTWDDGNTSAGLITGGTVNGSHTYTAPGVYLVSLVVTDDDGGSQTAFALQYVVIFDPSAGFVTGSGNFNSPLGAYAPNPSLEGKAHFGFSVKYLPGDVIPSGTSQFRFRMADLDFSSTSYQWLVISGQKAMFKGNGTIGGVGDYTFYVTAIDGSSDMFRIKITDNNTNLVIYDNEIGSLETADPTTPLMGGSIVIH